MTTTSSPRAVARSLFAAVRSEQLTFLAAAIAYYAFVSTVPLVILAIATASILGGEVFARNVVTAFEGFLTPEAGALLESALTSDAGREGATLVGLAVLVWSGLKVFRALDLAFSQIYGVDVPKSLLAQLRDVTVVLGAIGLAFGGMVAAMAVLPRAAPVLGMLLGPVVSVLVLPVAFLPLYYVFPDSDVEVREALPGALFAGLGWTVLAWIFALYTTYAGSYQLYGLVGAVLLVLTWYYAGGLLILLGALFNVVLAGRIEDRQLQQVPLRDGGQRQSMEDGDEETTDRTEPVESVDTREVTPAELEALRREVDDLAADLEAKSVARTDLEADLRRYVRWRQRRGHARGWGPYLVLLYGTVMTLGAFFFLDGGWAVLAMIVVWLSTLGLFVLMVIVGVAGTGLGLFGTVVDRLRNLR